MAAQTKLVDEPIGQGVALDGVGKATQAIEAVLPSGARAEAARDVSQQPTPVHFAKEERASGQAAEIYRCRVRPEELEKTEDENVKYCGHCRRTVHRVRDFDGFTAMVAAQRCMWVEAQDQRPDHPADDLFGDFEPPGW